MAAADDNKNMPKLEASIDTTDDPRIIINHDNPPHQHQHPSNYFAPAIINNNNANHNALLPFNNGDHAPPPVGIPPAPINVVAASLPQLDDDQVTWINDREYFASFPPGYRFCPLDRELIVHYLHRKVHDLPLPRNQIPEVNLYRYTPDSITERYPSIGENQWYFFTPRDKKYMNGTRPNRAAGTGFWKATGADKAIYDSKSLRAEDAIGFRKALVYYEGKPPKGKKTNWIMHEFKLKSTESPPKNNNKKRPANDMRLDDFVLCKLYKKVDKSLKSRSSSEDGTEATVAGIAAERGEEIVKVENGTHQPNFSPSQFQESLQPYIDAEINGNHMPSLHPSHSHNELNPSYPLPIPLQFSYQTGIPYPQHSRPELPHVAPFRCQPPSYYHQQHHTYPPISNSKLFMSQPYPTIAIDIPVPLHIQQGISDSQQGIVIDMKPQENVEYPYDYGYHTNDNSVGEYFVDAEFDNATPVNAESLDDSYMDSSSSQYKNSFDSTEN